MSIQYGREGWFLFERASDGRQSGFNFNQVLCGRSTFGLIASLASELIGGEAATAADADENLEVRADVEAVIHCSRSATVANVHKGTVDTGASGVGRRGGG